MYQAQQLPFEGAAPFAQADLPEQGSNPQAHQGPNQQWQQVQPAMGPIGNAYNGAGTQYNIGPSPFHPVDTAVRAMEDLQVAYLEQGLAIGEALATMMQVRNMQQDHYWMEPQQQLSVGFAPHQQQQPVQLQHYTGFQQQPAMQRHQQYINSMPHNTGFPQQQQPMQRDMEQPDVQQQQHPQPVLQLQPMQPQVNNGPIVQLPTPQGSLHNLHSSSAELLLSSSSNNHLPEDDPIWRDFHSLDAFPATNDQVSPPTQSLSATSPMAAGSSQNSQLLLPSVPVAAMRATGVFDWDPAAFSQRRQQQKQPSSGRKHRQTTTGSSRACDNQQIGLSSSESSFDKESVVLRVFPVIFLFPGKNDMISLDLCTAIDGFCEKKTTSKRSIRHFVKHILTKIYSSPNASTLVTADCEKSSKGFKIVPEESLRTLAEFWMTHFKSNEKHGLKEVATQMGHHIKTYLNIQRLALKNGRTL